MWLAPKNTQSVKCIIAIEGHPWSLICVQLKVHMLLPTSDR